MYGIVKKVKNGDILTKEEEQELFTLPPEERKEILLNYLSKQYYLKDDTKLFDLPPNERIEVLLRYMMNCKYDDGYHHSYILSDAAILKMFDLPKKEKLEILSTYISTWRLTKAAECKLLELPKDELKELLYNYIDRWKLCEDATLKIFDLPIGVIKKFLLAYIKKWSLSNNAMLKIFDLKLSKSDIKEICTIYVARWVFRDIKTGLMVFNLSEEERQDILYAYITEWQEGNDEIKRKLFKIFS
jgi:hypothetical protein